MKTIRLLFLMMLILTLTLVISSCDMTLEQLDGRFEKLEDRIENKSRAELPNDVGHTDQVERTNHPESRAQTDGKARKDNNAPISEVALIRENAESIALEHAGISTADALYLHTEFELDDGIPVYEVNFYADYVECEYTIHADTGAILEFDRDR